MPFTYLNLIGLAALVGAVCTARYIWWRFFSYQGIPKHITWVGAPDGGAFSRAKVALKSFFGLKPLLVEGYQEYSKRDQLFILPNIVNGHEVIIPTKYMPWLLEQHDNVLSQYETNRQFMCGDYTMLHKDMLGKNWPRLADTVKREMTRDLDEFSEAMADEVQDSLKCLWGSKTDDWHEINLYDVMLEVVGRVANRVFVGLPLCRNPGYLQASMGFSKYILLWAMAIEMLPQIFKPVIGPLLTAKDYIHYKRMDRYIAPIVKERLAKQQEHHALGEDSKTSEPNDCIQWAVRDMARHGEDPANDKNAMLSKRLAIISFTAIQSSAITITNAVVDIAATPLSIQVQESLRSEVEPLFNPQHQEHDPTRNPWSRNSLSKLPKLDSILTETLRLWGILTHGVTKAVVPPEGITLPSGEHIPCGVKVGIASYGPHLDEQVYGFDGSSPLVFDAFRFCKPGAGMNGQNEKGEKKKGPLPGLRFVTTTEHYMGFSHGRHAW